MLVVIPSRVEADFLAADHAGSLKEAAQDLVEGCLLAGASIRFTVSTTSMLPTLRPGDALIVEGEAAAGVRPGEMVVIRNGNTWVVHRLIRRKVSGERYCFVTKGDNRRLADPGFDATAPVGVVKRIQRGEESIDLETWQAKYGGRVLAWLSAVQAELGALETGLFRRLITRGLQRGIYRLAWLVYKI